MVVRHPNSTQSVQRIEEMKAALTLELRRRTGDCRVAKYTLDDLLRRAIKAGIEFDFKVHTQE